MATKNKAILATTRGEIEVSIDQVDPELAKEFLAKMGKNRHVTQFHVQGLARDMKAKRWVFNADPIRFNGESMIDGMHRCNAIIASGTVQEFLVVRGLTKAAFDTIDIGRKRLTADYLGMEGHRYPIRVASAARWYLAYKRYGNFNTHESITNTEKLDLIKEIPQLANYVQGYSVGGRGPIPLSTAMLAACHLLFWERNKGAADEFMDGLTTGLELKAGDPRATVRNWIIRRPATSAARYGTVFTVQGGNLLIRGWNAWRAGEQLFKILPMKESPVIK